LKDTNKIDSGRKVWSKVNMGLKNFMETVFLHMSCNRMSIAQVNCYEDMGILRLLTTVQDQQTQLVIASYVENPL